MYWRAHVKPPEPPDERMLVKQVQLLAMRCRRDCFRHYRQTKDPAWLDSQSDFSFVENNADRILRLFGDKAKF